MGINTLTDIKAFLYLTEPDPCMRELAKEDAIKLEYVNYKCARQRNDEGIPFGTTQKTILDFAAYCIADKLDVLYDRINELNNSACTIIFNPVYGEDGKLERYTRALSATGYVISISEMGGFDENIQGRRQIDNTPEAYKDRISESGKRSMIADSVTMQVEFLVNSIKYLNEGYVDEDSRSILYINY